VTGGVAGISAGPYMPSLGPRHWPLTSVPETEDMLAHCGYTGIATVTGDLPMRYPSPAAWWESGWSRARRISWQHIPNSSWPTAQTEVVNLLDELRSSDGSITRTPRYGWTTACRPLEPGPVTGPGQDQA
jgi:hypothetical protein